MVPSFHTPASDQKCSRSLQVLIIIIIIISKYKDQEIEIQKMWHLKAIVIPVVVGALGMMKKKTEDHIK